MEYKLGLNIGITTVGWGIIESENNKIINSGVRLFPEADPENNQKRRAARSKRRIFRRKAHRLNRLRHLLFQFNLIEDENCNFLSPSYEVYNCRKKGLSKLLDDRELSLALYQIVKRRGANDYDLLDVADDEDGMKAILLKNEEKLSDGSYVCEVQLNSLEKEGKIRGKENVFKTKDLKNEALRILNTQKEFGNKKVTDEFINKYIDILERKRTYYEGPGQESPYSWKDEKEWLQGLMGKCTYFPEEIRMIKHSYSAELFNLLNDLNNLKVNDNKLTFEEKKDIIDIFKTQKNITLKKIAKYLGVDEECITGYRIDKSEKAIFTPLETYITINKVFKTDNGELIDSIAEICTFYQEASERRIYLSELLKKYNLEDEKINELAKNKFTGTHSFSKKLLDILIPEMMKTTKNSMQVITELGLIPYKMDFTGQNKINKKYLDEWIVNPVVKKAIGQCINVINEIIKQYGTPKEIVVELCKEFSSKEERMNIKKYQAQREKENKIIQNLLGDLNLEKRYFPFVKFWKEQNGKCMLSGDLIPLNDLINNISKYEIAHIIPISISFDNSSNNKMLVKRSENIKRGIRTPFAYFENINVDRTFEDFENQVSEMKISKNKKDLLLYKGNLNKNYDDFISRNLNDTRYVVKEVKSLLNRFFIDNNKDVIVRGINNSFVTYIRNIWNMPRLKATSYSHYAEDALILITAHSLLNKLKYYKRNTDNPDVKEFYYIKTGEILDDESFKQIFNLSYKKKIMDYTDYKYSHFVDKKPNRQMFNETIYSLRKFIVNNKEVECVISKVKDIYDKDNMKIAKLFEEKKSSDLLIYDSDVLTYDKLEKAYYEYKDYGKEKKVNPLYLYYQDNGYIKQGIENNGSVVKKLKMRDKAMNTYFDISHKYINPKGKVVVNKVATYRMDIYSNGKDYKLIFVRYPMIKFVKNKYIVNKDIYNLELERKNITKDYKLVCSLFDGDIFDIKTPSVKGRFKFRGVSDERQNKIAVDYINKSNSALITALIEIKNKFDKNPELKIAGMLNSVLGTTYDEREAKEHLLNTPLSSKQKVITLTKILYLRKRFTDVLGKTY